MQRTAKVHQFKLHSRRGHVAPPLVLLLGLGTCLAAAYKERVLEKVDPIRLSCPGVESRYPAPVAISMTPLSLTVREARADPARAGDFFGRPPTPLWFHPDLDQRALVARDLARVFAARGFVIQDSTSGAAPLLVATLHTIFGDSYSTMSRSGASGYIQMHFELFEPADRSRWVGSVMVVDSVPAKYLTARRHEEALEKAYCHALDVVADSIPAKIRSR